MAELYLGQWEWFTDAAGDSYWRAPGGDAIGCFDLRNNDQAGTPGPTPQGFGLFVYSTTKTYPQLLRSLGSNLDRNITGGEKNAILDFFGLPRSTPMAGTLRGALRQWLVDVAYYDPGGTARWKPIRGKLGKPVEFKLGGFGSIFSETFDSNHPSFAATIATFQADYVKHRNAGQVPLQVLRKWTGATMRDLFGRMSDADALSILPAQFSADGWEPPATIISDNFNRADQSLDATGAWDETFTGWSIVSNTARNDGTNAGIARHTTALSSDDHKAKATITARQGAPAGVAGVTARNSTDTGAGRDCYRVASDGSNLAFNKYVDGTFTALDSSQAITESLPDDIEIECDGSAMRSRYNGTLEHDFTDTSITGNLYCGITGRRVGDALDDFIAEDLSTLLLVNTGDDVTAADFSNQSLTALAGLTIDVADAVTVAEFTDPRLTLRPDTFDSVIAYDISNQEIAYWILVSDDATVVIITGDIGLSLFDAVTVADDSTVVLARLTIDQADSLTAADDITALLPWLAVYENETVTVAEVHALRVNPLTAAVDENVTVSEVISLGGNRTVDVFDSITTTDDLTVNLPRLVIDQADAVQADDATAVLLTALFVTLGEDLTVADFRTVLLPWLNLIADDDVTAGELVALGGLSFPITIDVSDTVFLYPDLEPALLIDVGESVVVNIPETHQLETISVAEDCQVLLNRLIASVFDALTVSDAAAVTGLIIQPAVFDAITVVDDATLSVGAVTGITFSVFESVTVSDDTTAIVQLGAVNVFDALTVTDDAAVSAGAVTGVTLSLFESVAVSDDITAIVQLGAINVFDALAVGDDAILTLPVGALDVFDSLSIADDATVIVLLGSINVFESVTVAESVAALMRQLKADLSESVTVAEVAAVATRQEGQIIADETVLVDDFAALTLSFIPLDIFDDALIDDFSAVQLSMIPLLAFDSVGVTDDAQVVRGLPLEPDVAEDITIADRGFVTVGPGIPVRLIGLKLYDLRGPAKIYALRETEN